MMWSRLLERKRFAIPPVHITSAISTFIFAMMYGLIEHTLLASPLGISVLVYPLNIHLAGQFYFYHIVMLVLATLISFNPFFDKLIFGAGTKVRLQSILWGTGNILNFIWLEDIFYFILFAEWPKDVMTPFHVSFYGIVWWYPVALGTATLLYWLASRRIRKSLVIERS
ncbi:MAG: hypothetical protein ACREAZ_04875 [Nitrososphaera sp.]